MVIHSAPSDELNNHVARVSWMASSLGPVTGPGSPAIATPWASSQPSSTRVRCDDPFLADRLARGVS